MSADFYQRPIDEQMACTRELAEAAVSHWNISCDRLELIKHRENAVYKLVTDDGTQYALRVHRESYHSDAALRSELQWMLALQQSGVLVPEVIPCRNGDSFASVSHPEMPAPRQIDLFAWVDGEQLGSVEQGLGDNTDEI